MGTSCFSLPSARIADFCSHAYLEFTCLCFCGLCHHNYLSSWNFIAILLNSFLPSSPSLSVSLSFFSFFSFLSFTSFPFHTFSYQLMIVRNYQWKNSRKEICNSYFEISYYSKLLDEITCCLEQWLTLFHCILTKSTACLWATCFFGLSKQLS